MATEKRCAEILTWLEGVYNLAFREEFHRAAWTLLHDYPDDVIGLAAQRMVDEGEHDPSPAAWLRRAKALLAERRQARQLELTQERLDALRLPHASASTGREEFEKTFAQMGENFGRSAPKYPSMGLREILAVRALVEDGGKAHDEAYKTVREEMLRRVATK